MRVLHLPASPFAGGYSSDSVGAWPAGELREVEAPIGSYLIRTFPEAFVEHHDPQPEPAAPAAVGAVPAEDPPEPAPENAPKPDPKKIPRKK